MNYYELAAIVGVSLSIGAILGVVCMALLSFSRGDDA